jgi:hypothetical protein
MTTHKINDREYLFLEVPEGAMNFELYRIDNINIMVEFKQSSGFRGVVEVGRELGRNSLQKDYTILGIAYELTEEQAFELVDKSRSGGMLYTNYISELDLFFSATDSLKSLITSLGLNPETTLIIERKK